MQELNLSANYLDAAMLPAYVSGTPHAEQYVAWNAPIRAAFGRLMSLTSLDLSCNNLTTSNLQTLLGAGLGESGDLDVRSGVHTGSHHSASSFHVCLQSLDISGNTLTPPTSLVPTLQQLTMLTRLNVADTALRTADMQQLAPALACITAMRWLSIGSNRITHRAARALGRALVSICLLYTSPSPRD